MVTWLVHSPAKFYYSSTIPLLDLAISTWVVFRNDWYLGVKHSCHQEQRIVIAIGEFWYMSRRLEQQWHFHSSEFWLLAQLHVQATYMYYTAYTITQFYLSSVWIFVSIIASITNGTVVKPSLLIREVNWAKGWSEILIEFRMIHLLVMRLFHSYSTRIELSVLLTVTFFHHECRTAQCGTVINELFFTGSY